MVNKGLIVAGGHVNHDLLLKLLKTKDRYVYIMAVDHGMDALWVLGFLPDGIIGDFDSCHQQALTYFRKFHVPEIKFQAEKDTTDTDLAIEKMIALGLTSADMVGTTGTRLDHTLANMMLLFKYGDQIELTVLDDHNCITVAKKTMTIQKGDYPYISLLPISDQVQEVTFTGVKYPLDKCQLMRESSYAISNEIVDESCHLSFVEGKMLVIQSKD